VTSPVIHKFTISVTIDFHHKNLTINNVHDISSFMFCYLYVIYYHYITLPRYPAASRAAPHLCLMCSACYVIIIIGSTALGGPWPPQANVINNLYPGDPPTNFQNPVSLRLPLPQQSILISVGHILFDLQDLSTISI